MRLCEHRVGSNPRPFPATSDAHNLIHRNFEHDWRVISAHRAVATNERPSQAGGPVLSRDGCFNPSRSASAKHTELVTHTVPKIRRRKRAQQQTIDLSRKFGSGRGT